MPITGGGVWTFTTQCRHNGQAILNVVHLRDTFTGTINDYMADAFTLVATQEAQGGYIDLLRDCMAADVMLEEVRVQPVYPQRVRAYVKTYAAAPGGIIAESLPQNVSAVITKYAEDATRRGRGSLHVGGVPIPEVTEGLLSAAHLARLQLLADHLEDFWESGQFDYQFRPILWSRTQPTNRRDIITTTVQNTARVMRRRTVGVGI